MATLTVALTLSVVAKAYCLMMLNDLDAGSFKSQKVNMTFGF